MKHVSEEQLVAYRDGEDDPRVREHLASCEKCQQKYDDSRWSLSLQRLVAPPMEGKHPSAEELTAFWDNALSPEAARRVQRHLRSCNRCLAVYRRMRGIGPARAYRSPGPDLVRAVQKRISSRPSPIDLGEWCLRRVGGALQLVRVPAFDYLTTSCSSELTFDEGVAQGMPLKAHPSSARSRRRRFAKTAQPKPTLSEPVDLEAGKLRVGLQVVAKEDKPSLRVTLHWADTGEPARDVPLRIDSGLEGGDQTHTNEQGRAALVLPDGPSQLVILARTPVLLRLNTAR